MEFINPTKNCINFRVIYSIFLSDRFNFFYGKRALIHDLNDCFHSLLWKMGVDPVSQRPFSLFLMKKGR